MSKENGKEDIEKKILKKSSSEKIVKINKFSDLEGKFLLVKVGTVDDRASYEQIKDVEDKLIKLFKDNNVNCLTFVTHHAVDFSLL